ncbi:MAG: nucleotidyltransferase domain-containing protein [Bacteroidota bacterium]|nr:nucleotidyltransferase domain-containing protein [Bacteroidota bacterium]
MRLNNKEIEIIKSETVSWFGKNALVYLFGSRVDDSKAGGDIDLLICNSNNGNEMELNEQKLKMLARLKMLIGDQKIDILLQKQNDQRTIVKTALNTGVEL